jgi:ribosome-associated translation inhibitor RaiA
MYTNAIITKSLPKIADTNRSKLKIDDSAELNRMFSIISKEATEEEALMSLDRAVKKLHHRLRKSHHYLYTPSLERLLSIQ